MGILTALVPLATIVLTAYNNEHTVTDTLRSLLEQNYSNFELIVVFDESSRDATGQKITDELTQEDTRIRLLRVTGSSRSAARNVGWKTSLGEIIFFADGDDIYSSDYLGKAVNALASDPLAGCVCVTGASLTDGSGLTSGCLQVYSLIQRKLQERDGWRPSWAWVYRRTVLEEVGGFDEQLSQSEDKDLFIRVANRGYRAGLVGGVNWFHRRPSSFISYLRKSYEGGDRMLNFHLKHGSLGPVVRATLTLWLPVLSAPFWASHMSGVTIGSVGLAAIIVGKLVSIIRRVWVEAPRKRFVLLFPFFSLAGSLATGMGLTHRILLSFAYKVGKPISDK